MPRKKRPPESGGSPLCPSNPRHVTINVFNASIASGSTGIVNGPIPGDFGLKQPYHPASACHYVRSRAGIFSIRTIYPASFARRMFSFHKTE